MAQLKEFIHQLETALAKNRLRQAQLDQESEDLENGVQKNSKQGKQIYSMHRSDFLCFSVAYQSSRLRWTCFLMLIFTAALKMNKILFMGHISLIGIIKYSNNISISTVSTFIGLDSHENLQTSRCNGIKIWQLDWGLDLSKYEVNCYVLTNNSHLKSVP